jgi:riboflavin kinase/FMN adenylyltransferase
VLDVDEDFYGHEVGVDFVARLRGQERYDDLDALVAAIHGDVARTRELLTP